MESLIWEFICARLIGHTNTAAFAARQQNRGKTDSYATLIAHRRKQTLFLGFAKVKPLAFRCCICCIESEWRPLSYDDLSINSERSEYHEIWVITDVISGGRKRILRA